MAAGNPIPNSVQFGVFELDLAARELRKHGIRVKLQEQPFMVLSALIERHGETVTKDDLRQRVWPKDTFVDFDHGLHSAITRVREALGDSSENPRFVETVPRRGYRFIAPVKVIGNGTTTDVSPEQPGFRPGFRLRTFSASVLAGLSLGGLILAFLLSLNIAGFRSWLLRQGNPVRSLAVLPLENLSGDPAQDYFVDGMTDALITELSKINALRVISRTSSATYKGTKKALPDIARELNVDGIVEGSVVRSGNRVRIAAQLIHGAKDEHLWAETYERDLSDILKLQSEVAQDIAKQVRVRLTPQQQSHAGSYARVNPRAYEAYLRGRYFWNQRTEAGLWKSVTLFQEAIDVDPNSALPYVGLADAYLVLDSWTVEAAPVTEITPKATAAVERALQLDPTLAEAHTVLAGLKHSNWDWIGAGIEYRRAIELNPNYAHSHQWYGQYLCELGRFDDGLAEADQAHALDPLNLILGVDVGNRFYWARRYPQAIIPIQKTLELDPNFRVAHRFLGQVYEQDRIFDRAAAELERAAELSDNNPIDLGALGHLYALSGQRDSALRILDQLRRLATRRYISGYEFALVYVGLGRRDDAVRWLEKAFEERSAWMLHLKVDPRLDPLRSDPRFQDLQKRVGLPL